MKNSHIQWTDHTWNPWIGCTKVDTLCAHCYAEARDQRFAAGIHWGKGALRQRTKTWGDPIKWNRDSAAIRQRVFSASLADWLDDEIKPAWLRDMLDVVRLTTQLDWLLLSKRPELWRVRLEKAARKCDPEYDGSALVEWIDRWLDGEHPDNVWIGTSVGNQESADARVLHSLRIPARIHFLSCEPLLGPVDLARVNDDGASRVDALRGAIFCDGRNEPNHVAPVDWVICGGESGHGAREMDLAWARSLRDQCHESDALFFMKQIGGRTDHRGEWDDLPEDLRIRDIPSP